MPIAPCVDRHVKRVPALWAPSCPCCSLEDVAMRESDLAPFWRSSIGFGRLFDLMDETLRLAGDDNSRPTTSPRWPRPASRRRRSRSTAGQNMLTVKGRKAEKDARVA